MTQSHAGHLVVGSDSLVGNALFQRLQNAGETVVGTTRRRESVNERCLYLDLTNDGRQWDCRWPVSVAIVCAGVTRVQACQSDPVTSGKINVESISNLIEGLVSKGAFVIYLSTNQVFDGSAPHQLADAPTSPKTEYGRQKAETERRIGGYGKSVAIVRFTKILGPHNSPFSEWTRNLRDGKEVHAFSDMTLAPVPLSCAITVLRTMAELRQPGIFQVSGDVDVSYVEAARAGAKALGLDAALVRPVMAAESQVYCDYVPAHTTLNVDRLRSTMGIVPPAVSWTIETAFSNAGILSGV